MQPLRVARIGAILKSTRNVLTWVVFICASEAELEYLKPRTDEIKSQADMMQRADHELKVQTPAGTLYLRSTVAYGYMGSSVQMVK